MSRWSEALSALYGAFPGPARAHRLVGGDCRLVYNSSHGVDNWLTEHRLIRPTQFSQRIFVARLAHLGIDCKSVAILFGVHAGANPFPRIHPQARLGDVVAIRACIVRNFHCLFEIEVGTFVLRARVLATERFMLTSGGVSCICSSIAASWSPMPKFSVAVSDTGQTPATLTGRGNTVASRGIAVHAQKRLDKGWHGSRDVFSHLGLLTGCDGEARQGALGRTILSRRLCCPLLLLIHLHTTLISPAVVAHHGAPSRFSSLS